MAFDQPHPTTLLSTQTNCKQVCNESGESAKTNICEVCGGKARCFNYGAITCLSCRAFFRRHGFRSKIIRSCPFKESCKVRVENQQRKACIACRLAKCLAAGMNASFFRQEVQKTQGSSSLTKAIDMHTSQYSSSKVVSQLPTLDLLNCNRSALTSTHWTLLSNIVHAYDNFNPVLNTTGTTTELSRLPILQASNISIMLTITESLTMSTVTLLRSIPDFQILTTTDQRSLLQRNISGTCCLNFMFAIRDSGCTESPAFVSDYISICGTEAISRVKRFERQIDSDSTLVKLMLIVLAFSSNCSVLTAPDNMHNDTLLLGTFRLLGSQNVYVELLWKYMVYRYGYHDTVIRFAQLIKQVLNLLDHMERACMNIRNNPRFHLDNMFFESKRSLNSNLKDPVPLWGNT